MAAKERTTTYRWPDDALIRRIDVREQKNGFAVAYIYADDREEERAARTDIRNALRMKGWGTLSDSRDGQFVLRVTGLRSGDELVSMLREHGFSKEAPQTQISDAASEEKNSVVQQVRSRTLRWSGILATVGNLMSIASGFHRKTDPAQKKTIGQIGLGASFAIADLPLALVDEKDNSRHLTLLLKRLRGHYDNDGIEIPKNASIYVETSDEGKTFGERSKDFIHAYANQIKCGFEVIASGFSIKAGLEQAKAQGLKGLHDKTKAGLIFGPGFLASLLIPEKKIDEEKYAQAGAVEKLWMKIQSNPLSIGGLLGYSNTYYTYKSAITERSGEMLLKKEGNPHTSFYRWDFTIPTIMIGANGLYAVSPKTIGGDSKKGGIKNHDMVQDAYRIAAQIINKQPDGALREKAIESTARFFGERMEIKENYAEAKARLIGELDSQRANPWFEKTPLPAYTPQPKKPKFAAPATANPATNGMAVSSRAANEETSHVPETAPLVHVQAQSARHEGQAANDALATIRA